MAANGGIALVWIGWSCWILSLFAPGTSQGQGAPEVPVGVWTSPAMFIGGHKMGNTIPFSSVGTSAIS